MRRVAALAVLVLAAAGCGGGGGGAGVAFVTPPEPEGGSGSGGSSAGVTPVPYATTSTLGDLGTWRVTPTGVSFTVSRVDTAGVVVATYTGTATCTAPTGAVVRTCTITSASSSDAVTYPVGPPGTVFSLGEAPSRSLVVRTTADFDGRAQLHVGVGRDADPCARSVAGSYVFLRTLQSGFDLFGFLSTDSAFATVRRADFGFGGTGYSLARLAYTTAPSDGVTPASSGACASGVRTVSYAGVTGRLVAGAAAGGALVLDLPQGQGGLVAFDRTRAAGIASLAGRTLRLIEWTPSSIVSVATEAAPVASALFGSTGGFSITLTDPTGGFSATLEPTDNASLAAVKWAAPFDYTTLNVAAATFGAPSAAPGLFQLRRSNAIDNVVLVLSIDAGGKVWGLGTGYVPTSVSGGLQLRAATWFQIFEQ